MWRYVSWPYYCWYLPMVQPPPPPQPRPTFPTAKPRPTPTKTTTTTTAATPAGCTFKYLLRHRQLVVSIPRHSAASSHFLGKINAMGTFFSTRDL